MDNHLSRSEYNNLEELTFPIMIAEGTSINDFDPECEFCGERINELRAKLTFLTSECAELRFGGYCTACNQYDSGKLRWYINQNRILDFQKEGIVQNDLRPAKMKDVITTHLQRIVKFIQRREIS